MLLGRRPPLTLQTLRDTGLAQGAIGIIYRGDDVVCPCCGSTFRRFRGWHGANRVCWTCGSLERHRSLRLYFDQHPGMLSPGMRLLHVAPEPALARHLTNVPGIRYVGGDLNAEFGTERIDVTRLHFADDSFDAIICNHVLEHVPDDAAAMRELRRVLARGGWAILMVPDVRSPSTDEDPSVTDRAERQRRFGQVDHVRRYGWDYVDRLGAAGFDVTVERPETMFSEPTLRRCRLAKSGELEPIFLAR